MLAKHFQHPIKHFPGIVRRVVSDNIAPFMLFKEINADKGLGNAVRFFWNIQTFGMSCTVGGQNVTISQTSPDAWEPVQRAKPYGTNPFPHTILLPDYWDASGIVTTGSPPSYAYSLQQNLTEIVFFTDLDRYGVYGRGRRFDGPLSPPTPSDTAYIQNNDTTGGSWSSQAAGSDIFDTLVWSSGGTATADITTDLWNYA